MENAFYSVISPEGCSTILFKDAAAGAAGRRGAADDAPRPAAARRSSTRSCPSRRAARTTTRLVAAANLQDGDRVATLGELLPLAAGRTARPPLPTASGASARRARSPSCPDWRRRLTDDQALHRRELIASVWQEARDLVKRLEGSTVVALRPSRPATRGSRSSGARQPAPVVAGPAGCPPPPARRPGGRRGRAGRPPRDRRAARRHLLPARRSRARRPSSRSATRSTPARRSASSRR